MDWSGRRRETRTCVRVLLCTPPLLIRQALSRVLSAPSHFRLVGEVATATEAVRWALQLTPDVIVLDEHLEPLRGIHAATAIQTAAPNLKLLLLADTGHAGRPPLARGGATRISMRNSAEALIGLCAQLASGNPAHDVPWAPSGDFEPLLPALGMEPALTSGERELLGQLMLGCTNRQIACDLECSEQTVARHLTRLYAKLEVRGRTQAAIYAVRHGLTVPR